MDTKQNILTNITFGHRVAEDEFDPLSFYFVQTHQWVQLIRGEVDIVYGPKGSGKSALYGFLFSKEGHGRAQLERNIHCIGVNRVFDEFRLEEVATEDEFRQLWRLYFLTLLVDYLRMIEGVRSRIGDVISVLIDSKLLPEKNASNLATVLTSAWRFVATHRPTFSFEMKADATGAPSALGKLSFAEPTPAQAALGYFSVASALRTCMEVMKTLNLKVWIGVDRLDSAFSDRNTETNALRGLFRTYIDLKEYEALKIKIFLRDDIWKQIARAGSGFREASNIALYTVIRWDKESLLNLIARRVLQSRSVIVNFGVRQAEVLEDASRQIKLFERIFPQRITEGARTLETLDWMLEQIEDASSGPCPRELLHLIQSARGWQMRAYEQGTVSNVGDDELINESSLWKALPELSEFRFRNTLCAEYPVIAGDAEKLFGSETTQTLVSLMTLFEKPRDETVKTAERLVEAGFFSKRFVDGQIQYVVPHVYRRALKMSCVGVLN